MAQEKINKERWDVMSKMLTVTARKISEISIEDVFTNEIGYDWKFENSEDGSSTISLNLKVRYKSK